MFAQPESKHTHIIRTAHAQHTHSTHLSTRTAHAHDTHSTVLPLLIMDANTIALLKPSPLKRLIADEKAFKEYLLDKRPFVAGGTMRQCLNILVDETKLHGFANTYHMFIDNDTQQNFL